MDYEYDVSFTNLLMSDDNVYNEVGDDNPDVLTQIPNENVVAPTLRKAQRTKNFTPTEDNLLVSGWLNTSKDAVTGNEQQSGSFWKRILNYFVSNGGNHIERSQSSLKNRWCDINMKCAKFVGFYSQVERRQQSGQTENGRVRFIFLYIITTFKC